MLIFSAWMLTISFVINNYWSSDASVSSVKKKLSSYVINQEKKAKSVFQDKKLLHKLISSNVSETMVGQFAHENYFLFLYDQREEGNGKLKFWNTQQVIPQSFMLYGSEDEGFVHLENGYYVWERYEVEGITGVFMFPVKWDYFIENEYLKNNFFVDPTISSDYELSAQPMKGAEVISLEGKPLFYVYSSNKQLNKSQNIFALISQLVALLSFLLFIHLLANYLSHKKGLYFGFLFLIISLLTLFGISEWSYLPFSWNQYSLFKKLTFGNYLESSLGEMLIHSIGLLWSLLFIRSQLLLNKPQIKYRGKWVQPLLYCLFAFGLLLLSYYYGSTIHALVLEPEVSFDVINFFSLDQYSIYAIITITLLSIVLFVSIQLVLTFISFWRYSILYFIIVLTVLALALLSFMVGSSNGNFYLITLFWLTSAVLISTIRWFDVYTRPLATNRLVFWIAFQSLFICLVVKMENDKKELEERKKYAITLAQKSNQDNEVMVNTMLTGMHQDFLQRNFLRFSDSLSSSALKDSIISSNSSSYTNNFDTKIYTFDPTGKEWYNQENESFDELNAIWQIQAKPTSENGLKYFDQSFDVFSYLSKKEVTDTSGNLIGSLFVLATPKSQRKDAIYPELFSKGQSASIENATNYATALYNNNKLIRFNNDYPFPTIISSKELQSVKFLERSSSDHNELWYNAGAGVVVLIVKKSNPLIEVMTLFSYFFFGFLSVLAFLSLINALVNSRLNRRKLRDYWQLSIKDQIHGAIITISILSFIVIALASVAFFTIRNERNNREKLNRTIRIMEKEAKATFSEGWDVADSLRTSLLDHKVELEKAIRKISDIHGVDVNIYDLNGDLQVSSLPLPYNKGILSTKMNPTAYYHLHNKKEIEYFHKENIGQLSYISNYIPLVDAYGNDLAYINIPYFTSQNIFRQEISNFLITIINLNAFIFLLAGIFAVFITERIGYTISLIGEKMKAVSIDRKNEQIKWERDDEIGALVKEYNKMVFQLEESAAILAKNEREGAWREMARQVAHEIKNPLTPMKLSMQFLQKSIENGSPNINELAKNVSLTLIEQIDHLSNIANAFSQFASIGEPNKELFDLNETLRNILVLYETNENVRILRQLLPTPIMVYADKTQIHRLFTNLIINGIQSVPENRMPKIIISQRLENERIITSITDNGTGIEDSIKGNIFTPNFTTKTSGTGLGLAMCKRISEQSDGDLYFDTILGEGTTFTVSLPLHA